MSIEAIQQWLDKLQGLPAVTLVFFSCIVTGYVWRLIPWKWFNNDVTPIAVINWGVIAMCVIAETRQDGQPVRIWIIRNMMIGGIVGLAAWMTHALVIKRIEYFISSKLPTPPVTDDKPKP